MLHEYGSFKRFLFTMSLVLLNRHLERTRIIFAIENEMSIDERKLDANKYWTNLDGERYLQVEEVDKNYFRDINNDDRDDGKDKKRKT